MVAEGALQAKFVEIHVPFQDDFTRSRDFEIDGLAFDQLNGCTAEKTANEILLDFRRGRNNGRKSYGWVGSNRDRDLHFSRRAIAIRDNRAPRGASHHIKRGPRRLIGFLRSCSVLGRSGDALEIVFSPALLPDR